MAFGFPLTVSVEAQRLLRLENSRLNDVFRYETNLLPLEIRFVRPLLGLGAFFDEGWKLEGIIDSFAKIDGAGSLFKGMPIMHQGDEMDNSNIYPE